MHPNFIFDPGMTIVLDASVIINLNATCNAPDILDSLENRIVVVEEVVAEINAGRQKGRPDAALLENLIQSGTIDIVELSNTAIETFESLVIGPASSTLDDGESATIAYARTENCIAIIDETKAHRICKERFPRLKVGCTADIFIQPNVQRTLGEKKISISVTNALQYARMQISSDYLKWVIGIVGLENVEKFKSLPRVIRQIC